MTSDATKFRAEKPLDAAKGMGGGVKLTIPTQKGTQGAYNPVPTHG